MGRAHATVRAKRSSQDARRAQPARSSAGNAAGLCRVCFPLKAERNLPLSGVDLYRDLVGSICHGLAAADVFDERIGRLAEGLRLQVDRAASYPRCACCTRVWSAAATAICTWQTLFSIMGSRRSMTPSSSTRRWPPSIPLYDLAFSADGSRLPRPKAGSQRRPQIAISTAAATTLT